MYIYIYICVCGFVWNSVLPNNLILYHHMSHWNDYLDPFGSRLFSDTPKKPCRGRGCISYMIINKYIYIYNYIYSYVQYPHYILGTQQFPKAFPKWSQAFRLPRCCRPNPSRGAHHRKLKKELRSNQMDMVKFWLNMWCLYIYIYISG